MTNRDVITSSRWAVELVIAALRIEAESHIRAAENAIRFPVLQAAHTDAAAVFQRAMDNLGYEHKRHQEGTAGVKLGERP